MDVFVQTCSINSFLFDLVDKLFAEQFSACCIDYLIFCVYHQVYIPSAIYKMQDYLRNA